MLNDIAVSGARSCAAAAGFASWTIRPLTMVSTLVVRGSSAIGTLKMSCESRATSASMPGAIVPFWRSANSAAAEPRV